MNAIDDERWLRAVAELPSWVKARCYASIDEVELEFETAELRKEFNFSPDVRAQFFETLGGQWDLVDRRHRFKTIEVRYRLHREEL